jgi:transposase
MKQKELIIGIDVSKKTLDLVWKDKQGTQHLKIKNEQKAIASFCNKMVKKNRALFFCFENTGVYSFLLCTVLQKKELPYSMVNALALKRSLGITRGKSDKADAKAIAKYATKNRHELQMSKLPADCIVELKLLIVERSKCIKANRIFSATKENNDFIRQEVLENTTELNCDMLSYIKQQIKKIDKKINELIAQNATIKSQFELIQSVPGVGPQTAIEVIVATNCFTCFDNPRKFACYIGIAPFEYQSGTSIRGRTRVSPLANKKLKATLNMAALSAKKRDPQLKQYYHRKTTEGKNGMLVMNALRNKLVQRIFATVKRGTPYVKLENYAA